MEKEKFICKHCGKEYKTQPALKAHITKVHGSKKTQTKKKTTQTRKTEPQITKQYADHDLILVKNGTAGELVYIAPRSGVTYMFDVFGDEQEIPFGELKATRMGNYATFFKRQWFLIDDKEAIKQLGIEKYYNNQLTFDELNGIFDLKEDEIREKFKNMSDDQKNTLGFLTVKKMKNKEITDLNIIRLLEDLLHAQIL